MNPVYLGAALFLLVSSPSHGTDLDAREWLDKMSHANQTLNYEGTFVYLHGGQLEAMRVIHRADEKGERERMVSLNGSAREVLRDNEQVTCILPDSRSVVVDKSRPRKPFPSAIPRGTGDLAKYYRFEIIGEDRVAGSPTRVISIMPLDRFRYGYRLWLDKDNNILLKSDLTDERGEAIEQVMFTGFRVLDSIPPEDLVPDLSGEGYTRVGMSQGEPGSSPADGPRWKVDRLPAGFMLTHHIQHRLPSSTIRVEHMVFSDGLAAVSVYIDRPGKESEMLVGSSTMGAVNAFGRHVAGHHVTVVGEVPLATVKMMASSTSQGE